VSLGVYTVKWVANLLEGRGGGGAFIAPQENLAVGVSEIRTTNLFGSWLGDRICLVWDLITEELG
jgi:hypothetical protein